MRKLIVEKRIPSLPVREEGVEIVMVIRWMKSFVGLFPCGKRGLKFSPFPRCCCLVRVSSRAGRGG